MDKVVLRVSSWAKPCITPHPSQVECTAPSPILWAKPLAALPGLTPGRWKWYGNHKLPWPLYNCGCWAVLGISLHPRKLYIKVRMFHHDAFKLSSAGAENCIFFPLQLDASKLTWEVRRFGTYIVLSNHCSKRSLQPNPESPKGQIACSTAPVKPAFPKYKGNSVFTQ